MNILGCTTNLNGYLNMTHSASTWESEAQVQAQSLGIQAVNAISDIQQFLDVI